MVSDFTELWDEFWPGLFPDEKNESVNVGCGTISWELDRQESEIEDCQGDYQKGEGDTRSNEKEPREDVEADLYIISPVEEVHTKRRETSVR